MRSVPEQLFSVFMALDVCIQQISSHNIIIIIYANLQIYQKREVCFLPLPLIEFEMVAESLQFTIKELLVNHKG